jgi:hypothetical protein
MVIRVDISYLSCINSPSCSSVIVTVVGLEQGHRKQSIELMPGATATVDMIPDASGR